MDYTENSCREFVKVLASSQPAPGGGGAAALVGAVGTALGNMVGSLTVGKKKYAQAEEELLAPKEKCDALQDELLDQVAADAENFEPLAAAYSIPKDDPAREETLEEASKIACSAPLRIMELCCESIDAVEVFAAKGSVLALSDAGCAAVCLKAALQAASLNIYINTKGLKNRSYAKRLNSKTEKMLAVYSEKADKIYESVRAKYVGADHGE